MRRCYQNVALILGAVLMVSNTFSNSCSIGTLNVYAAEAARTGEENVETEIPAEKVVSTVTKKTNITTAKIKKIDPVETTNTTRLELNDNEYTVLLKIVEAEAGSEDLTGKMLVANVIINRMNSDSFPDTITEVVYQRNNGTAQFSPTADGRIDSVKISEETVNAVNQVLNGEDSSNGALFFRSVYSKSGWFDRALTRVVEHGNHIFYTI